MMATLAPLGMLNGDAVEGWVEGEVVVARAGGAGDAA
jgi:hypothetical protein